MRDLVVREALQTMARGAAKRFRELVAAGEEIPYEVLEPSEGSPLFRYKPRTARFIRTHLSALRELDSFGSGCTAMEAAGVATRYLESLELAVPREPHRRAELAGATFLSRLWADSTDFSLDRARLEAAVDEVDAGGEIAGDEIEVCVPLRGFHMPAARLGLATTTIVRADLVDAPAEARAPDGAAPWEPAFLAVHRVQLDAGEGGEAAPDPGIRGTEAFRALITTLRLFKPGGVGLGPHAWTRGGVDRWRRVATGAGRLRPGGYLLEEPELSELIGFSCSLSNRSTQFGRPADPRRGSGTALVRAISRFEAGLERQGVLEALSDYLLALRFVLAEGGPAELGLPMRVAALAAEPDQRGEVKAVLERALRLERELWTGDLRSVSDDQIHPADLVAEIEDLTRAILKDAVCGHLGSDLRVTADEILLAEGLAAGEGAAEQRGETAEWYELSEADHSVEEADDFVKGAGDSVEKADDSVEGAGDSVERPDAPVEGADGPVEGAESPSAERPLSPPPPLPPVVVPPPRDFHEPTGEPDTDGHEAATNEVEALAPEAGGAPSEAAAAEQEAGEAEVAEAAEREPELWLDEVFQAPPQRGDSVQVPASAGRITGEREPDLEEQTLIASAPQFIDAHEFTLRPAEVEGVRPAAGEAGESSVERMLARHEEERKARSSRLAQLFPRPDTIEWSVGELDYGRRRASVESS